MKKIDLLEKGSSETLLSTTKGNELIGAVNKLLNIQVKPDGAGKVEYSDANVVIEISKPEITFETKVVWHNGATAYQGVAVDGPPRSAP